MTILTHCVNCTVVYVLLGQLCIMYCTLIIVVYMYCYFVCCVYEVAVAMRY